jgi:hypothetical protein
MFTLLNLSKIYSHISFLTIPSKFFKFENVLNDCKAGRAKSHACTQV